MSRKQTSDDKPGSAAERRHGIVAVVWPGIQSLDLVGPYEVFSSANRVADSLGRSGCRYDLQLVGPDGSDVATESGLRLVVDQLDEARTPIDTLLLPGGDGVHQAAADETVRNATRTFGRQAGRIATVCTGTFLAAAAGLIQGKRVATHWARADRLARDHPDIEVDAHSLHINDGNVWSSAGVTAGMDLALAMVENDHDAEVAQIVARWLVLHLRRPGGQSQFAAPVWFQPSSVEPIRRAQERIEADPAAVHTVAELASLVGLSPRHFSRLFTAEVGESPARFVDRVRVEAARRELELSDVGMTAVAKRCGFGSTETMRRAFQRRLGLAPDDYRRRFQVTT